MRTIWVIALLCGCVVGRPGGFSAGSRWVMPLVDPLDDDRLLTPVTIDGKGPYLFAIDPDAPGTAVDAEVLALGEFRTLENGRVVDESDTSHGAFYATVTNVKIGTLTISQMSVLASNNGAYSSTRRRIYGVIGRDVLLDSVVFGFDRERGIAWLEDRDVFKPPPDVTVLSYYTKNEARTRHLVDVKINGKKFPMHVDLGDVPSQLRTEHWGKTQLAGTSHETSLVDFYGTRRKETMLATATVEAGGVAREVGLVPFGDRRWSYGILEGALGLDFFRPYVVIADWHERRILLTPRDPSASATAMRLGRWDSITCGGGCAEIDLVEADDRVGAHVTRDVATVKQDLEVVFIAKRPDGTVLPALHASFPAGVYEMSNAIDVGYRGAMFELADVSPYPYQCQGGCVVSALPVDP